MDRQTESEEIGLQAWHARTRARVAAMVREMHPPQLGPPLAHF